MRPVLICPDDLLEHVVTAAAFPGERPLYLVSRASLRARLTRRGDRAMAGKVTDATFLRHAFKGGRGPVVVAAPAGQLARVTAAVKDAAPDAPLLVLRDDDRPVSNASVVPLSAFGERIVQPALERATQRARAERLRAHFYDAERVLILMQDDPDPDAIASALALKTLLGRTRTSAPMCTFGTITRPENVAMCKILEIEVEAIDAAALDQFDRVAMVDVQPSFLEEERHFGEVDLVIDHHPVEQPIRARIKDVRPSYGATSTIMVEYLRAADVKISQRLATALLYGIKSDTLGLERGGTKADLEAFTYLYLLANHNALRRIERPELSPEALDAVDWVPIEVPAGGAAFHDGWVWHGSPPNERGDRERRAIISHMITTRTTWHPTNTHSLYSHYRRPGETELDEAFFPVMWREDGYRTPAIDEAFAVTVAA